MIYALAGLLFLLWYLVLGTCFWVLRGVEKWLTKTARGDQHEQ